MITYPKRETGQRWRLCAGPYFQYVIDFTLGNFYISSIDYYADRWHLIDSTNEEHSTAPEFWWTNKAAHHIMILLCAKAHQ